MEENETFKLGKIPPLNACVGNNGFNDINTYEDGYHISTKVLIQHAKNNWVDVDPLIYPICFSARHRIELFLKDQLHCLKFINEKADAQQFDMQIIKTHDLKKLWNWFKELTELDDRYNDFIDKLKEYLTDFFEIDLTGQTFRYPFSNDRNRHLTNLSCINIGIFEKRYDELNDILDDLDSLTEYLVEEYEQQTIVRNIPRNKIEFIAKKLPNRDRWGNDQFIKLKEELMEKFDISSNTYSEILDLIQEHREFSQYINIENKITEITPKELQNFSIIFKNYLKDSNNRSNSVLFQNLNQKIKSKLNDKAVYCLRTLFEIGYFNLFSESYSEILPLMEENRSVEQIVYTFYDNKNALNYIKKALKKLGQITLLDSL